MTSAFYTSSCALFLHHMLTLLMLKNTNSCSQVVFVQQNLADKGMCYGVHAAGIVGCVAFYIPPNLPLNTGKAHLVKHIKLGHLAKP